MKRRRGTPELPRDIKRELAAMGLKVVAIRNTGSGHKLVRIENNEGNVKAFTFDSSATDNRGWKNSLARLKRFAFNST
jgi:hypothetical protein